MKTDNTKVTFGFRLRMLGALTVIVLLRLLFGIFSLVWFILCIIPMLLHKPTFRRYAEYFSKDLSEFKASKNGNTSN